MWPVSSRKTEAREQARNLDNALITPARTIYTTKSTHIYPYAALEEWDYPTRALGYDS